jgi:hypothetical protein
MKKDDFAEGLEKSFKKRIEARRLPPFFAKAEKCTLAYETIIALFIWNTSWLIK